MGVIISDPTKASPGDLVAVHGAHWQSRLIQFGEWIRFRGGSNWTHMAVIVSSMGTADPQVIQAIGKGAILSPLSQLEPDHIIIHPTNTDGDKSAQFALDQEGTPYAWLSDISVGLNILTPKFMNIDIRPGGRSLMCSALAQLALLAGGDTTQVRDYYQITPAEVVIKQGITLGVSDRAVVKWS